MYGAVRYVLLEMVSSICFFLNFVTAGHVSKWLTMSRLQQLGQLLEEEYERSGSGH